MFGSNTAAVTVIPPLTVKFEAVTDEALSGRSKVTVTLVRLADPPALTRLGRATEPGIGECVEIRFTSAG